MAGRGGARTAPGGGPTQQQGIRDMVYAPMDTASPRDGAAGGRHKSEASRAGADAETPVETRDDAPDSLDDGLVGLMFGD